MLITRFWARGYRSLVDVTLDDLGAFNVFYGPNGAGKSNLLAAMQAFVGLSRERAEEGGNLLEHGAGSGRQAILRRVVTDDDFNVADRERRMVLGVRLEGSLFSIGQHTVDTLELAVELLGSTQQLRFVRVEEPGRWELQDLLAIYGAEVRVPPQGRWHIGAGEGPSSFETLRFRQTLCAFLTQTLPRRGFALVESDRHLHAEAEPLGNGRPPPPADLPELLAASRLKEALFRAQTHPNHVIRTRFRKLQEMLAGPPLGRPPFVAVQDPVTRAYGLRESVDPQNPDLGDVPLDIAGLGVVQIYAILANVLLRENRCIGLEEPEANLHAPTSGRALRDLLVRLVDENLLDQLFVSTHSNLFDLHPTHYYDVRAPRPGVTEVRREPLEKVDERHLYEPGPARHALLGMLGYLPPDEVVFRRPDGAAVTATEMITLLRTDDAIAVAYLQDVAAAAIRAVRLRAKAPAP